MSVVTIDMEKAKGVVEKVLEKFHIPGARKNF